MIDITKVNISEFVEQLELSIGDAYTLRFMESKIAEAETEQKKEWAETDLREFMETLCNRNIAKLPWASWA